MVDDILIRIGTEEDRDKIEEFATRFSENPKTATEQWLNIIKNPKVLPLVAEYRDMIVGKIQARISEPYSWLESAKVSPKYRHRGIGRTLFEEALEWLENQDVKYIRALVDADNLTTRNMLEKKGFQGNFLSISPSRWIHDGDSSPRDLTKFSNLLDETAYDKYAELIKKSLSGNIMVDGNYVQFTSELFEQLISERRIMINGKKDSFLVFSTHKMPDEMHVFVHGDTFESYLDLGRAAIGLANQEVASFIICHAPCNRTAVDGLVSAGLGWEQPHSNIIYQKKLS